MFHPFLLGFVSPVILNGSAAERLGRVVVNRQNTVIIDILRHFKPRIAGFCDVCGVSGYHKMAISVVSAVGANGVDKRLVEAVQYFVPAVVAAADELYFVHALKQQPLVVCAEFVRDLRPQVSVS